MLLYERAWDAGRSPGRRNDGVLVGLGVTLSALVIQGVAVTFGVEAIGALMAERVVGIHLWRNGVATLMLAFGWSTAAIVTIFILMVRDRHRAQMRRAQVRDGRGNQAPPVKPEDVLARR